MTEIFEKLMNDKGFIYFLGLMVVIIIGATISYLHENTLFFERCAGVYYKHRIDKDIYRYVRKVGFNNMYSPINKTLSGIFKIDFGSSPRSYITHNIYKSPLQIQTVFKVFQYVLTRLENSQDFMLCDKTISNPKIESMKIPLRETLNDALQFIDVVLDKEDLTSIDTTLCFNGVNLSEKLKQCREENKKCRYRDLVDSVINFNCGM